MLPLSRQILPMAGQGFSRQFQMTYAIFACTLWFSRGAESQYVAKTRREIYIRAHKQSFGMDTRRVMVPFYVSMKVDENGESVLDKAGNPG